MEAIIKNTITKTLEFRNSQFLDKKISKRTWLLMSRPKSHLYSIQVCVYSAFLQLLNWNFCKGQPTRRHIHSQHKIDVNFRREALDKEVHHDKKERAPSNAKWKLCNFLKSILLYSCSNNGRMFTLDDRGTHVVGKWEDE